MILQKSECLNLRTIQVMKNRYDGDIGNQHLAFNPDNKRYFEITDFERQIFKDPESKGTISKLIAARKRKYNGEIEPELINLA